MFSFQVLFFIGGIIFFVKQLFKNYEIKHVSIQLIFSITFALSLTLFELIIFEIAGVLESSSRFFHWRFVLSAILVMVVAVIPYHIAHSFISNIRIGETLITLKIAKRIDMSLISSWSAMVDTVNCYPLAGLPLLLLEDWRSLPSAQRQPRHFYNRARRVTNRSCWSHRHGDSLRIRCGEFSIHQHDLLYTPSDAKRRHQHRAKVDANDGHDSGEEEENRTWATKPPEATEHDKKLYLGFDYIGDHQQVDWIRK